MAGYRRVPDFVREQIDTCSSDTFVIGRARRYASDEANALLERLGVTGDASQLTETVSVVPGPEQGRWSKYNAEGRVHVRRDLPKVSKTIGGWQVPYFGDWDKGSFTANFERQVFPRELWYNAQYPLMIDAKVGDDQRVTIAVRVDRVFDRRGLDERDLLLVCSLLRENTGSHASALPSNISVQQWLRDQIVDWELLPVGVRGPATFVEVARKVRLNPTSPRATRMRERYDVIAGMNPGAVVVGQGEFSRYFGFKFADDLVALENLDYGNALYVMYRDWDVLSRRTRGDLLSDTTADFDRIVHNAGWESRLVGVLTSRGHSVTG